MDSDEKTSHCCGSYCAAIKFVMQSFCEFVTEACMWPPGKHIHVGLNDSYISSIFIYTGSICSIYLAL